MASCAGVDLPFDVVAHPALTSKRPVVQPAVVGVADERLAAAGLITWSRTRMAGFTVPRAPPA